MCVVVMGADEARYLSQLKLEASRLSRCAAFPHVIIHDILIKHHGNGPILGAACHRLGVEPSKAFPFSVSNKS